MNGAAPEDATENLASTERVGTDRQAKGLFVPVSKYRTFNPGSFMSIRDWTETQSHDNLLKFRTTQTEAPESANDDNKRTFMSLPRKLARCSARTSFNNHLGAELANVSDPEVPGFLVRPPVFSPIRTLSSITSFKKSSFLTDDKMSVHKADRLVDTFQAESPDTGRKTNTFLVPSDRNNQLLQTHSKSNFNAHSSTFTPEFRIDSDIGSFQQSKYKAGVLEPAANLDHSKSSQRIDTNIDLAEILLKEDRFQSFVHFKHEKEKKTIGQPLRSLHEADSSHPTIKSVPAGPPIDTNSSSASE